MSYANLTFAHGNGPYSKTLDLAVAVNERLMAEGNEPLRIIIPLAYGETQRRIMLEDHRTLIEEHPDLFLLDETQGKFLGDLLFQGKNYNENLRILSERQQIQEGRIRDHLSGRFNVKRFDGSEVEVNGSDIRVEISCNPRLGARTENSFHITQGYLSEILGRAEQATLEGRLGGFDAGLLREVRETVARKIEDSWRFKFMSEPFTFSYDKNRIQRDEIWTPPFIHWPRPNKEQVDLGVYVTVTGITGLSTLFDKNLSRLYEEFRKAGLKIYCSEGANIAGADNTYPPSFVSNQNISYIAGRAGWSTIWSALMNRKPFITPEYTRRDDPEIFFNQITLRKLGLGAVLSKNKSAYQVLRKADGLMANLSKINARLADNYKKIDEPEGIATRYDGIKYIASVIVDVLNGKDISKARNKKPVLQGLELVQDYR